MIDFKNFKIKRGPSKDLHDPRLIVEEGYWYLSTDKAELFIGIVENGTPVLKPINGELTPEVNLEGYATEDFVREAIASIEIPEVELYDDSELRNLINSKAYKEHTHEEYSLIDHKHDEYLTAHQDISHLATKEEIPNLDGYAKLENIPDVSKFITEIPAVYVTETELENKGYLTEHQSLVGYATESYVLAEIAKAALEGNDIDLSAYATKEFVAEEINKIEIPEAYDDTELRTLISEKADSDHTHEEYSLVDHKHAEYLTEHQDLSHLALKKHEHEQYLTEHQSLEHLALKEHKHDEYLTEHQSLEGYAKTADLFSKDYNDLANKPELFSGSYNDLSDKPELFNGDYNSLTNKPEIPSIEGLATETFVTEEINKLEIPEAYDDSELRNLINSKANYVHSHEEYALAEHTHDEYLTEHQSLADYAKKTDLFSKSYNDLTDKPTIPSIEGLATEQYVTEAIVAIQEPVEQVQTRLNTEVLPKVNKVDEIVPVVETLKTTAATQEWVQEQKYTTEEYVDNAIATIEHPANPTKVSELENDANYTNETKVLELIENNASSKIGIDFVTDITVGHLAAGTQISKDMTIGQLLYKMLFAGAQPEEPSNPEGVVAEIISKQLPMYSVKKDGTITADDFKLFTLTSEEATQAPTESGFYQIIDESNTVIESGYQELQIASDELYYVIALPKSVDYNSDMVKIQAYDDDEKIWNDCDKLPLINDPTKVSSLCNEAGIDISHIDTNVYTVWALEDICTGSKLRYIIIG